MPSAEYQRDWRQAHPLTEGQRADQAEYLREWRRANPDYRAPNAAQAQKDWRAKNPDYRRRDHLRRNYGLSLEEYEAMADAQGHRCAICGALDDKLVVDHCHDSNEVRGLLCDRCNVGIGCMGDNVERLMRAADYLAQR